MPCCQVEWLPDGGHVGGHELPSWRVPSSSSSSRAPARRRTGFVWLLPGGLTKPRGVSSRGARAAGAAAGGGARANHMFRMVTTRIELHELKNLTDPRQMFDTGSHRSRTHIRVDMAKPQLGRKGELDPARASRADHHSGTPRRGTRTFRMFTCRTEGRRGPDLQRRRCAPRRPTRIPRWGGSGTSGPRSQAASPGA